MMRLLLAATLFPVFSLGSANSLAEQSPGAVALQPGQWDMVTEMTAVEAPGAPEALVQQMRTQMAGQRQTRSQCITPEQARDPTRDLMGSENPGRCEFSETIWAGGNIRVRATCSPPGSAPVQLSLDGTYAARQIDGRISMNAEMANPDGTGPAVPIHFQGRLTGRRTGECQSQ